MKRLTAVLLSLLLVLPVLADGMPKAKRGTFAITNARLETVTNGTIERGTIVIRDDRIVALGANVAIPPDATVIDANGQTVYPGFIDSGTRLGLVEVGSLAETRDYSELGDLTPQMQALTAVNPNSVAIPITRTSGVTTVLTEPSGGLLPGTAALINLHGYTPEQMSVAGVKMMVMQFPRSGRRGRWDRRSDAEIEKANKEAMEKVDEMWDQVELYRDIQTAYEANPESGRRPSYVPEVMALVPVLRGDVPLMVKVDAAGDILKALEWIDARGLPNVVLSGVEEGWRVADRLAEAGHPVIVGGVMGLPARQSDRYDKAYRNAGLLHEAGVMVAIRTGESENVRNLPYHAGFAAAWGMGKDAALRAVTIAPAEIFGVADELGSLEVGKKANLFVADGDPFEPRTQVSQVFIDGYQMPMTNRQIRLYEEFLEREPGLDVPAPTVQPAGN